MIHPLISKIILDDFYSKEQASTMALAISNLQYVETEFGKEIENFSLVAPDTDKVFSTVLGTKITFDDEQVKFRSPKGFVHFEGFDDINEWVFAICLLDTTFNTFRHMSGAKSAREEYKFNYKNLFEWHLESSHFLEAGQCILFRPWIFHSFNAGLIQVFNLKEHDEN